MADQITDHDPSTVDGTQTTDTAGTVAPPDDRLAADLRALRDMLTRAKAMPMSASCIVNRAEALDLVDKIAAGLPTELAEARGLLDGAKAQIAQAETEANRIIEHAREQAAELAGHTSMVKEAEEIAARLKHDSEAEAAELRVETDAFIDERMAGFQSVLQKTASQVKTARARLSERSGLDEQG
jgi:F0F1-type ATP synthase membrane subunit b/b'